MTEKVKLHDDERLDIPDISALQDLVYEYMGRVVYGVLGKGRRVSSNTTTYNAGGLLSDFSSTNGADISITSSQITFNTPFYFYVVEEDVQVSAANSAVTRTNKSSAKVLKFDPDATGQTTTISNPQDPSTNKVFYLWARETTLDTDQENRRKWDVTLGTEVLAALNTRTRQRVEFSTTTTLSPPDTTNNWALLLKLGGTKDGSDPGYTEQSDGSYLANWEEKYPWNFAPFKSDETSSSNSLYRGTNVVPGSAGEYGLIEQLYSIRKQLKAISGEDNWDDDVAITLANISSTLSSLNSDIAGIEADQNTVNTTFAQILQHLNKITFGLSTQIALPKTTTVQLEDEDNAQNYTVRRQLERITDNPAATTTDHDLPCSLWEIRGMTEWIPHQPKLQPDRIWMFDGTPATNFLSKSFTDADNEDGMIILTSDFSDANFGSSANPVSTTDNGWMTGTGGYVDGSNTMVAWAARCRGSASAYYAWHIDLSNQSANFWTESGYGPALGKNVTFIPYGFGLNYSMNDGQKASFDSKAEFFLVQVIGKADLYNGMNTPTASNVLPGQTLTPGTGGACITATAQTNGAWTSAKFGSEDSFPAVRGPNDTSMTTYAAGGNINGTNVATWTDWTQTQLNRGTQGAQYYIVMRLFPGHSGSGNDDFSYIAISNLVVGIKAVTTWGPKLV